jgi:hypothetical protein
MKTIAIDFDGVLHKYSKGWNGGKIYDKPVENAVEAYYELLNRGYHIVIFTSREDLDAVRMWMHKYFDFERRLGHFYEPEITNKKPIAVAYIDDRAVNFTNWLHMLTIFTEEYKEPIP